MKGQHDDGAETVLGFGGKRRGRVPRPEEAQQWFAATMLQQSCCHCPRTHGAQRAACSRLWVCGSARPLRSVLCEPGARSSGLNGVPPTLTPKGCVQVLAQSLQTWPWKEGLCGWSLGWPRSDN